MYLCQFKSLFIFQGAYRLVPFNSVHMTFMWHEYATKYTTLATYALLSYWNNFLIQQHNLHMLHIHHQLLNHSTISLFLLDLLPMLSLVLLALLLLVIEVSITKVSIWNNITKVWISITTRNFSRSSCWCRISRWKVCISKF